MNEFLSFYKILKEDEDYGYCTGYGEGGDGALQVRNLD